MHDTDCVVFSTPTLIDIRAFTTFGVNSKPNSSNPIGYFGTGLKYAMAVLARENIPVTIFIGKDKYVISSHTEEFRNKGFNFVYMRRERNGVLSPFGKRWELPFTTELGKNWVLWQVYRELHSNTLDESGIISTSVYDEACKSAKSNTTRIIIGPSPAFMETFNERWNTFLDMPEEECIEKTAEVVIYREPSKHLYYRGLRVKDLRTNSKFTYNILKPVTLTEDRTLKFDFEVYDIISKAALESSCEEFLHGIVDCSDAYEEAKLNFTYEYRVPSRLFKDVARNLQTAKHFNRSLSGYLKKADPVFMSDTPYHVWLENLINAVELQDYVVVADILREHRHYKEVASILRAHLETVDKPEQTDYNSEIETPSEEPF